MRMRKHTGMGRSTTWSKGRATLVLVAIGLAGCGGAKAPPPEDGEPTTPDVPVASTSDATAGASDGASPEPTSSAAATAAPAERSPMEQLARDMMKNGRKIGWSPSKKAIAYGEIWMEGQGRGLRVVFRGADDKMEAEEICKPSECEETLDEKLATEVPKVAQKLESGGYQAVTGNGWAPDQPELELHAADLKLSYVKGKLGIVDGKTTKSLGQGPAKGAPAAVFLVKDDKVLVVDFEFEPAKSAGPVFTHELRVYKLP
jgi:hypothetical protein